MTPDSLRNLPLKSLTLPVSGLVDISRLQAVIDHPLFQRLRYRRQLGLLHLTFPGASHSRFEHSIGVACLAQRLVQRLGVEEPLAQSLVLYALLHDVGHAPFSHQIEPLFPISHRRRGALLLQEFSDAIRACGGDPQIVADIYEGSLSIYRLVEDRNLGADKLDYLARDAWHLGLTGAPMIDKLQAYLVFRDGEIAIEEKLAEEVKRCQSYYSYLYRHVYLNKQSLIVQRMLQRALQVWVDATRAGESEVTAATDAAIEERLNACPDTSGRELWRRLLDRRLLRSAVVVRIKGHESQERVARKPLRVAGISEADMRRFIEVYNDPRAASALEDRIAALLGLPPGDVVLASRQYFDKLRPRDVWLYSQERDELVSLFDRDPCHRDTLNNEYMGLFAVRVAVPGECRETACQRASEILSLLFP
ncbi:MAG TPA: HD domain-containing protein [Candidatus Brocadiia bacterium]|nr:HD domain-containing protein [Candidatus Brocadiia bacterium]